MTKSMLVALTVVGLVGARGARGATAAPQCSPAGTCSGFAVPECVVVDPSTGDAYVSNIEAAEGQYWSDDGRAFISRLKPNGTMDVLRWRGSTRKAALNAPKGMCILRGTLYAADNTRVVSYSLASGMPGPVIPIPGAKHLNDMATDGRAVYVSDTEGGKVYRLPSRVIPLRDARTGRTVRAPLATDGRVVSVAAPKSVNGITFHRGHMYCVSWDLHEVYEMDATGRRAPRAFGLASHFKNLDGIEVMDDGTFLVSDFTGNKVCAISPDRKRVTTLATLDTPADIGFDRKRNRLFVPLFGKDRVATLGIEP